jgi:hypothetical protein
VIALGFPGFRYTRKVLRLLRELKGDADFESGLKRFRNNSVAPHEVFRVRLKFERQKCLFASLDLAEPNVAEHDHVEPIVQLKADRSRLGPRGIAAMARHQVSIELDANLVIA